MGEMHYCGLVTKRIGRVGTILIAKRICLSRGRRAISRYNSRKTATSASDIVACNMAHG